MPSVECSDCHMTLADEPRKPCPRCGSTRRVFKMNLTGRLEAHSALKLKGKEAGKGGWFVMAYVRDEFFRQTQRWHRVVRLLDKRTNRYVEHIEDAESGHLIRHVDERLTEHREHGDAGRR